MRMAMGAMLIGAGVLAAAPVRAADAPPPDVMVADLLGWIDRNLAAGADASAPPAPPPALGEGPVGRMVGWLASDAAAPAAEVAAAPEPAPPSAARPAEAMPRPASAEGMPAADAAPLVLTGGEAKPAAAGSGRSLLLPLN